MLDLDRPVNAPYMILESDIECPSKAIHVLNFGRKDSFIVGRRVSSDISISDISVSRRHSLVRFDAAEEKVYVGDTDSKFGTFKLLNGPHPVDRVETLPVQIEKKCFFFTEQTRQLSSGRFCPRCLQRKYAGQDAREHDYFLFEFTKYPESACRALAPVLWQLCRQAQLAA